MTPEIAEEQLVGALEATANELLWEAEIARPPVDVFVVARRLGLLVAEDQSLAGRGRFARMHAGGDQDSVGVILLGAEDRRERRQWAVAHEIGEATAQRVFDRLGVDPIDASPSAREQVANGLAGRLLLPRRWFARDGEELDWDLFELKHDYQTASHELIARRTLEVIRRPTIATVLDHGAVSWRRSNFGPAPRELLPEEQRAWQPSHEDGIRCESLPRAGEADRVRCWPVHEPGWRREIILTELPAWE